MYETNEGYEIRLEEGKARNPEMMTLFEQIGVYLDRNFAWNRQSAFSQEKKPKYRLTLKEDVSRRPNITVVPYKGHVQIRVAHRQHDEELLNQLLPKCFEKKHFKDKVGNGRPVFTCDLFKVEELECLQGLEIRDYFLPNKKERSIHDPGRSSNTDDKEFTDEVILSEITTRRGQLDFRRKLLERHDNTCIVTGCKIGGLLEAAHITPHSKNGSYSLDNGLLLRSDIHTLFDLNLLGIDGDGCLHLSSECQGSEYEQYRGRKVIEVSSEELRWNLRHRFEAFTASRKENRTRLE